MRAGGGLATGRPSPRVPHRVNAAAATLVHHGLASPGDVDPNQGRLLSHAQMGHLTKTDDEMAQQTGVVARRPAGRGFLSGVGRTKASPYDTSAEARAAGDTKSAERIAKRKKEVISTAAKKTGSETPLKTIMENRARYESDAPTKWYAEGASDAVAHEALKSGVSHNTMRRAAALTSPQKPWDKGHIQDNNYSMPNVEVAGHLVRFLKGEQKRLGKGYRPSAAAERFRMPGDPGVAKAKGFAPEDYKVRGQSRRCPQVGGEASRQAHAHRSSAVD